MKIEVLADADSVAKRAAAIMAGEARAAAGARGRFVMAVSGGHTPWLMLRDLADEDVPWENVHVVQVDERVAPPGDPDRNLTHLRESLLEHVPLPPEQIYAMPVESPDLDAAAAQYAENTTKPLPVLRPCSTWSTWAWGRMATPRLWCLEIRCLPSPTRTWL